MDTDRTPSVESFDTAPLSRPVRLPVFRLKRHITIAAESDERLRDIPYITRGRDLETATMARRIQGAPSSIQLITAAPGAGKSALMGNIKQLARAWGCAVITLSRRHFHSDLALAKAIWHQGNPVGRVPAQRSVVETEHVAVAPGGVGATGTRAETTNWEADQPEAWADAIQAVDAAHPGRPTVLFLDEVQRLDRSEITPEAWDRAEQFLQYFQSDVFSMEEAERPRTILICAGLLNAQDVLNSFNISRVEGKAVMRLGPLSRAAAATILQDHMTARTPTGAPLPKLPEGTVEALIHASGGSAHHIAEAGLAAQQEADDALDEGQFALDSDACERIMLAAREGRESLYNQRVVPGDGSAMAAVALALAQAMLTHGIELRTTQAQALIRRINQCHDEPQPGILKELQRKGIIEYRAYQDYYPTRAKNVDRTPRYALGIPSMATWLNEQRRLIDPTGEITDANSAAILETMGPAVESTQLPPWTWDHQKRLPKLKPMPTAEQVADINDRVQQGLTAIEPPPPDDEDAGRSAGEIALDVGEDLALNVAPKSVGRVAGIAKRIWRVVRNFDWRGGQGEDTQPRIAEKPKPKQLPPKSAVVTDSDTTFEANRKPK